MARDLTENVEALLGPPAKSVIEKKIDYGKTKAPNFTSSNQPGKKKSKKK